METNLLAYIWRYTKAQQAVIIGLTLVSFPILYLSLEIPKIIVNEALSLEPGKRSIFGLEFEVVPFLVILCLSLLSLIVFNGVLKRHHRGTIDSETSVPVDRSDVAVSITAF
jgi:putative ABC transport system ATP-binding protein